MSDSGFLQEALSIISGRREDIDEKISRLKSAKSAIETEQDAALKEIKRIEQPSLSRMWEGKDAEDYDSSREDAYDSMRGHIRKYDYHLMQIDWEIRQLELQRGSLDFASTLARQAQNLLDQGEEMANEVSRKINQLKGRLFG